MGSHTLAIIAGGSAKRLGGRLKPLISVGGRTVLSRLLELLPAAPRLLVTNTPAPYASFPGRIVGDLEPGRGAPGGVVTALIEATTPWVLIVAGDMPFIGTEHAERLIAAQSDDVDVVVASRDDELEPLCAVYRQALGARFRTTLASNPSLQSLVASVPHRRVMLDPRALDSLNTADDLTQAISR